MFVLKPRTATPNLTINTLKESWSLAQQAPENFTMVVVYRGLHCSICKNYLKELSRLADDFIAKGMNILVLSSDTEERAAQASTEWEIENLTMGYGLTVEQSQAWGLHRSAGRGVTSIGIEEPAEFTEPGLFLVRPDGTLYWSNISTMPFARPHFKEVLGAIEFAVSKDYPARGELI
ncbi:MAG: AhpC/TSA family protein [Gammaproteobacteria bacterium]|nr:AhpC/TSA family protein [Gammaproteobacteria bacterium]MBU1469002.1 AhpC/TSA family protein [Gammaproteobacteria bacterium]MBU2023074.1 AhpC/TSA family protein [Gammaproteobacteria bacterium]MBU2238256.1 AhpC/TSA family protein [Gammaproteobacteria bacterium]MBU2320719.1 AhpC/TSA family protein [Gammaproteobacteria bacterium]